MYRPITKRVVLLAAGCKQVTCVSVNEHVKTLPQVHLSHLDMSDCDSLTDTGLEQVVSCCRRLTGLYVRRCLLVTDAGLQSVATHCQALSDLSVAECARVTDAGVVLLAVHLGQSLAHLSVAHCPLVGDRALVSLADRCCRLRYVNARGCGGVTDRGVTGLATSSTGRRLRALDVSGCVGVGDAALRALACGSGSKLRRLAVYGCTDVSDYGVSALALYCRRLRQLNVQDCPLVSANALTAIRDNCYSCVVEHNCIDFY